MASQTKPNVNTVWASSGTTTSPGTSKINTGWVSAEEPEFEYMNYLQNQFAEFCQHINLNGVAVWDTTTEYETNAVVKGSNGRVYVGLTATNQGNNPTSSPTNWRESVGVRENDRLALVNAVTTPTAGNPVATSADVTNAIAAQQIYGGIHYTGVQNISMPLAATYYGIAGYTTAEPTSGVTVSTTNGTVTVGTTGKYLITADVTFAPNWGTGSWNSTFALRNGTTVLRSTRAYKGNQFSGTGDYNISMSMIATLTAADVLQWWVRDTQTNKDVAIYAAGITIHKIG